MADTCSLPYWDRNVRSKWSECYREVSGNFKVEGTQRRTTGFLLQQLGGMGCHYSGSDSGILGTEDEFDFGVDFDVFLRCTGKVASLKKTLEYRTKTKTSMPLDTLMFSVCIMGGKIDRTFCLLLWGLPRSNACFIHAVTIFVYWVFYVLGTFIFLNSLLFHVTKSWTT